MASRKAQVRCSKAPGENLHNAPQRNLLHIELSGNAPVTVTVTGPLSPKETARAGYDCLNVQYVAAVNLSRECAKFQELMDQFYLDADGRYFATPDGCDKRKCAENRTKAERALRDLAIQGHSVFVQLFERRENFRAATRIPEADREKIRRAMVSVLKRQQLIEVHSEIPLFPWPFLFDRNAYGKRLDLDGFWGFRHELQHSVPRISVKRHLPARPKFVVAICPQVVGACVVHENAIIPALKKRGRVCRKSSVGELEAWFTKNVQDDCLYFYGHAWSERPPVAITSKLELDGVPMTVAKLQTLRAPETLAFTQNPFLLFLNGCETAPLSEWDQSSVAGYLAHAADHRLCCVLTVGPVSAGFAAHLADRFWSRLCAHKTLGTAVLEGRTSMMRETGNPLGLLYVLFGRIETQLCTAGEA